MSTPARLIPIFTTKGHVEAVCAYPYFFNLSGEWIGWVTNDRQVYAVNGRRVGWLSEDWRILCKREDLEGKTASKSPPPPGRIRIPAHFPLAPLMADLPFHILDVLDEHPERLPPLDLGERFSTWD